MMFEEETTIRILKSMGLTGNESRIYLALLKKNPATGYEISQSAHVPRSAIYSVLGKLESMNLVNSVGDRPRRFIPLPPEALINHFSEQVEHDLTELRSRLAELSPNSGDHHVWYIKGYDNMILKAKESIRQAQECLYLSIWRTEFMILEDEIRGAIDRGVTATIFSFCKLPAIDANVISYDLNEERLRQAWKISIILVADDRTAIMGGADPDPSNQVVWTDHPSLMGLATNHIILDITLAGIRLGLDINAMVAPMMNGLKVDLESLIEEVHPHGH